MLYDLSTNPKEAIDLSSRQRTVAETLKQILRDRVAAEQRSTAGKMHLNQVQVEALESLGYAQ